MFRARVSTPGGSFNPAHKFSTWLYTIATNLARDLQRCRARHPQVSLERQQPETGNDLRDLLPETRPDPAANLEIAERAAAVRQAVAALPAELRAPLFSPFTRSCPTSRSLEC